MCNFLSAWVGRPMNGDKPAVYVEPMIDSHSDLAELFKIKADDRGEIINAARVEFTPPNDGDGRPDYFAIDKYALRVDEHERPGWFDAECEAAVIAELRRVLERMVITDDTRPILVGGAWMFGDGAKVQQVIGGRVLAAHKGANLAGANLARAYLADADLAGAYLADADLAGANLADADLAGAYLADADLAGANLARANLAGANLADADLARANLADAYLAGANLAGAYLAGADLAGAYLAGANLAGADIAGANRPTNPPNGWIVNEGGLILDPKATP